MEEQLISFETAKLAKEKGLKINTKFNYYNIPSYMEMQYGSGKYHDDELGETLIEEKIGYLSEYKPNEYVSEVFSAPTQSLLQKWLRDKHNLHIGIQLNQFGYGFMYSIIDIINAQAIVYLQGGVNFKYTYEQALEAGLLQALNQVDA